MEYSKGVARRVVGSLAVLATIALIVLLLVVFLVMRPPHRFRIAAGAEGGAYIAFAEALRDDLAQRGFTVDVLETEGSVDNVSMLRSGATDVGIVQSGTDAFVDMTGLTAVSELFYEPVWIFYDSTRVPAPNGPADLVGKRVGIGPDGSGTNLLARAILKAVDVAGTDVSLVQVSTGDMLTMMQDGSLDVAFVVASPAAPIVAQYASTPGIKIFSYPRADALSRRNPFFTALVLPRGVLGIADDLPPADTDMVGVRATLMGKDGLQADLARLLAAATGRVLKYPLIGEPNAFPGLATTQFPKNEDAERYFKDGPTALEQFLPFDIASPLSRWWVLLLPLFFLVLPLVAVGRAVWSWFNTSRIVSWYPRLHWIERNLDRFSAEQLDRERRFLVDLDASLPTRTRVSAGYLAAYYDLRRTLQFVSDRVETRADELSDLEASGATPQPAFDEQPPETPEMAHHKDDR